MRQITAQLAFDALKDVVEKMGSDFVYQSPGNYGCVYYHNGGSCGVGKALIALGMPIEEVIKLDSSADAGGPILACVLHEIVPYIDYGASQVFNAFQSHQDALFDYGSALENAENALENFLIRKD